MWIVSHIDYMKTVILPSWPFCHSSHVGFPIENVTSSIHKSWLRLKLTDKSMPHFKAKIYISFNLKMSVWWFLISPCHCILAFTTKKNLHRLVLLSSISTVAKWKSAQMTSIMPLFSYRHNGNLPLKISSYNSVHLLYFFLLNHWKYTVMFKN